MKAEQRADGRWIVRLANGELAFGGRSFATAAEAEAAIANQLARDLEDEEPPAPPRQRG
jgi:hypothetical protein